MQGPLAGIKVIEIGQALAGPLAGAIMADMGADVIKLEKPDGGDDARSWGPPFIERQAPDGSIDRSAAYFHATNRGKRGITCDFRTPEGQETLKPMSAALNPDATMRDARAGGTVTTTKRARTEAPSAWTVTPSSS